MLFSSAVFLYIFLPITLAGYFLCPNIRWKNYWLLVASLFFFAWGGISFSIILIGSIVANYFFGIRLQKNIENHQKAYLWLVLGVSVNILLLGIFKYTLFAIENINSLFAIFKFPLIKDPGIVLPVGISFYTFHSLSYLVDIYRRKTLAQKNVFDLALYISMFSQLIAGPIIRYSDVSNQLLERKHGLSKFASGTERFLIGLGKKVLLANTFARIADDIFSGYIGEIGMLTSWLGIVCYTLQIYYDFSGYSDMAIGLGRMFGFDFMENFNFPYIATSIKEFWRRWHISLSSFFRDYVYIPLGGSRVSSSRTYVNLLTVFFLTGFWHGSSWNFVLWGLFHGFFIVTERIGLEKLLIKLWRPLQILYAMLVVMFGWVLFRADTIKGAVKYWNAMLSFRITETDQSLFAGFMNNEFYLALIIALAGAFGIFPFIKKQYEDILLNRKGIIAKITSSVFEIIYSMALLGIMLMSTIYLIAGTYNPFIYFRF